MVRRRIIRKHGTEEDTVFVGIRNKWNVIEPHPTRHVPLDEGEVEHIDDSAFKHTSVAFSPGYEFCDVDMC